MIDIDHVSFQYSGAEQENLQDFNLQIKKGECVVLTGESGCGKTCVTRLINTLIPHFYEGEMSGAVLIDGVDTRTIQPHDLSDKIGSVFQNPRSQFFSLDTDSEIVFGMENKGMPYQVMLNRYQQTIRELHIEKLKDRNLFDLSGGQKQTIAFASVYALNPDIFVLDEPSSNLDPEAIQELRRLLLLIKAQGKTIVVSEHRLYFLNGIADRIVLMEHGKLKQSWSARDFALLSTEQIKALGLRSYTPARLELPETMPSRNDTPAVEVKDLAIGYEKGKPVAQHLNFRVYPGEIVGVVGKNGCGKSTLARTLCGLQKELRGEVLYQNSMIPSKRRIRKAYLVMQDPDYQLFTDSVYQELLLALSDQKDKDEKRIFYLLFVPAISGVLNKIMYISESFMQIDGNVARMDEILNIPEMPETSHPKKPVGDDVAFHDVSFSYTGDVSEKALENVSFSAKQGQITAIVGPSGGGKSTIANLISRFWDVSSGSITIGGVDVRDMAEDDLMRHVSFVFQDIFLFKQSILDNIRMGNPSASEEQVIAAAKAAQCHEFISNLPNGYHTVVGSKGIHLSGGERQRIAIARAIIKDSPIIVLDEATAFSDPENEVRHEVA